MLKIGRKKNQFILCQPFAKYVPSIIIKLCDFNNCIFRSRGNVNARLKYVHNDILGIPRRSEKFVRNLNMRLGRRFREFFFYLGGPRLTSAAIVQ